MAQVIFLLKSEDINTQEATAGSKHLNIIISDIVTINLSSCAIDELLTDLINHKNSFGDKWLLHN